MSCLIIVRTTLPSEMKMSSQWRPDSSSAAVFRPELMMRVTNVSAHPNAIFEECVPWSLIIANTKEQNLLCSEVRILFDPTVLG
jgi:hypothetical protein